MNKRDQLYNLLFLSTLSTAWTRLLHADVELVGGGKMKSLFTINRLRALRSD